jgi:serine/threonine protein kinase
VGDLELINEKLAGACCPEDVFGTGSDPGIVFKQLAKICHPDRHPSQKVLATDVFAHLSVLKTIAEDRVKDGSWGKNIPLPRCVPLEIGKYKVKPKPIIGDVCDLYLVEGKELLVKVARSHDDNDLLRAETSSLRILNKGIDGPVSAGVPTLTDTFQIEGTWKREVNVFSSFPGFVSAVNVHQKMVVDVRTAVWIFKRILTLLGWVHHFHLVHGAILPPHVLFYPDNDEGSPFALPGKDRFHDPRKHSIRLIDWCYSVKYQNRTRLSSWVPAWKDHYPPELLNKSFIGPASDIYMAAQLIWYLCGSLPKPLETILTRCLDRDHSKRYQKAGEVFDAWKEAAKAEFGQRTWHDFNLK